MSKGTICFHCKYTILTVVEVIYGFYLDYNFQIWLLVGVGILGLQSQKENRSRFWTVVAQAGVVSHMQVPCLISDHINVLTTGNSYEYSYEEYCVK